MQILHVYIIRNFSMASLDFVPLLGVSTVGLGVLPLLNPTPDDSPSNASLANLCVRKAADLKPEQSTKHTSKSVMVLPTKAIFHSLARRSRCLG